MKPKFVTIDRNGFKLYEGLFFVIKVGANPATDKKFNYCVGKGI